MSIDSPFSASEIDQVEEIKEALKEIKKKVMINGSESQKEWQGYNGTDFRYCEEIEPIIGDKIWDLHKYVMGVKRDICDLAGREFREKYNFLKKANE
jgi:hypothetical protein